MSTNPQIRFDRKWRGYSDGQSVVVSCTVCGRSWQALALAQAEARASAVRHLVNVHGIEPQRAEDRLTTRR